MKTIKYVIFALSMILMLGMAQPVIAASDNADFQLNAQSAASCPVEDTMITATLKNLGSDTDTYTITSNSNWVTIGNDIITLDAGETKTFPIWIKPKIDAEAGEYSITVTAESDSGKYQDSIDFVVMKCYGIEITPNQYLVESCIGDTETVEVTFSNTGKTEETFILTATAGKFDAGMITIASGAEKSAELSVPVASREDTVTITAQSTTSYASDSADIEVVSEGACYGIAVLNIPPEVSICRGDSAKIVITTKNTGYKPGTFELSTDAENAYFKNDEMKLESKEVGETYLEISTENADIGEIEYSITITSTEAQDKAYGKIIIEQCYNVELSAAKDDEEICPGAAAAFEIDVTNTGKKSDTYMISADEGSLSETSVTLDVGESERILLLISTDQNDNEDMILTVSAESERASASKEITVSVRDFDSCYGISISSDADSIFAEDLKGYLYTLTVKNDGEFDTEYTATIEGPKWITVNPETIAVKAGKTADIFVYASPEYTTSEGTYTIKVTIESDMGNAEEKELKFSFRSESVMAPPITGDVITDADEQPADDKTDDIEDKKFPTDILTAIIIGIIIILLIIFGPELLKDDDEKKEKEGKEKVKPIMPAGDDIPLEEISGIGGKRAEALRKAGVTNVKLLANANISDIMSEAVTSEKQAKDLIMKAKAILKKKEKTEEAKVERKEEPKKDIKKPAPITEKKAEVKKTEEKPKAAPVKTKPIPVKAKPAPKKKAAPAKKKSNVREERKDDIKQILDNI